MPLEDYAPSCETGIPGARPGGGPGWYLVAMETQVVEAGPFDSEPEAILGGLWMDDQARGVTPQPWEPVHSARGLVVGARRRLGRRRAQCAA